MSKSSRKKEKGSVSQCVGKKRYATLGYAESLVPKISAKFGKPMRAYYCGICNGYHLTSKSKD